MTASKPIYLNQMPSGQSLTTLKTSWRSSKTCKNILSPSPSFHLTNKKVEELKITETPYSPKPM